MAGVRLEPFGESHLEAVAAMLADPDAQRYTSVPEPVPDGFERTWLERYESGRRDGTREGFAIVDSDGAFLGLALAFRIDREAGSVELGYVVAPEARGRGVATEALRLLTAWVFDELGAERIQLEIEVENEPSRRVAERAGYVREGVLRSVQFKPGRRTDMEVWSRLPSDPAPT